MSKNRYLNIFANGIVKENPTFRLVLGMCPTLAVTTSMFNGLGMGLATTFVLFFSNMIISLLKKIIPEKVRIPAYIVVIASFVTIVEMVMSKFLPDLYDSLGVFISLIVVNCIIFARAESFASVNPVLDSMVDGLISFTFTPPLVMIASLKSRSPSNVTGKCLIRRTNPRRSSLVISLTFLSGWIPLNSSITGIIFAGNR